MLQLLLSISPSAVVVCDQLWWELNRRSVLGERVDLGRGPLANSLVVLATILANACLCRSPYDSLLVLLGVLELLGS